MIQAATHGVPFPPRDLLELHQELHARPALPARPTCVVSYWVNAGMRPERAEQALRTLCLAAGASAPPAGVRHHVLHAPGFALKYERHGEFISWQVNRPLDERGDALDDARLGALLREASALPMLPDAFVALLSGEGAGRMLAATHVLLLDARASEDLLPRCQALLAVQGTASGQDDGGALMGAFIADARRCALLTHLRLGTDGFTRFVLLDYGLVPEQAAREAQRVCEIEAYRMLAMLGFPVAQQEAGELAALEQTLQGTVDAMANDQSADDGRAFETLTRLAAAVEHSTARTRYRFSATRAYHRIVERRLADLREQRIDGVQTLSGFLARRFAPAMALCDSTDARLTDVAERISRAMSLARIRIEVRREEGNQELLRALAQRQKQQLQLQQTVEGLSVVAISYYALGLVGYLAKGAKSLPWLEPLHLQPDVVTGLAAVPVLACVYLFVQKLRAHLH
ncbi:MAG: hypothetical protein RLY78_1151 [Pseudomonadota bacterium]|uniref:DUF3422 domain-containing protein n=1 Tax=Pseudaquabacterium rugosum TaxID=2984194 RepID=A0ABU9B6D5_9BURK